MNLRNITDLYLEIGEGLVLWDSLVQLLEDIVYIKFWRRASLFVECVLRAEIKWYEHYIGLSIAHNCFMLLAFTSLEILDDPILATISIYRLKLQLIQFLIPDVLMINT